MSNNRESEGPPGVVQLLPVIGIGGLLGVSAGIVTMGTAVVVGAGTAAGVGAGKWIVDRIIAKRRTASGGGPRPESDLAPELQAALLGWQTVLSSKAGGNPITSRQLASFWSEFEVEEPENARYVQTVQGLMASGQLVPIPLIQRAGVTVLHEQQGA
eukprot:symbB.v1.2.000413.t1/scaffold30.1/size407774/29